MIEIMTHLHQYVLSLTFEERKTISTGEMTVKEKAILHSVLFGGDQLTVARGRGARKGKVNSQSDTKKLSGLIPVIEDWHAKANFLSVSGNFFRFVFINLSLYEWC